MSPLEIYDEEEGVAAVNNMSLDYKSSEMEEQELTNSTKPHKADDGGQKHHGNDDDGNKNTWGRGVMKDVKRTLGTHWKAELTNFNLKTIGVSFYMFFAAAAPAITFGALYAKSTNNYIGAIETITATAWCGLVYGFIGGQPMVINGGAGPVLAFATVLYQMSKSMDVPFLTLNAWTGLWICFFLCVAAVVDLNRIIKHLTRFTDEIFGGLIIAIYIIDGLGNPFTRVGVFWYFDAEHKSHAKYEGDKEYSHWAVAFLSCILTFGTAYGAFYLRSMKHSRFFVNQSVRNLICDFAVMLSIVFWTTMANSAFRPVHTESLNVPDTYATTFVCCDATCHTGFPNDCPDVEEPWGRRPWLVDLGDTNGKPWVPFFAIVPALLGFVLIFLINGITWHLIYHPSYKLTHGDAYNYDTIILGLLVAICSILGQPWMVAATVRAIAHVNALAEKDEHGMITHVQETRLTHILTHGLVLGTMFALPLLKLIPVPVLYGVFLYMGISSLGGVEGWLRFKMLFMQPSRIPESPYTKYVPHKRMHCFTLIQAVIFLSLIVCRSIYRVAIAFPLIILMCIPFRLYVLPRLFTKEELILLDGEGHVIQMLVQKLQEQGRPREETLKRGDSRINLPDAAFDFLNEEDTLDPAAPAA